MIKVKTAKPIGILLTAEEVSQRLGVKVATLQRWRQTGLYRLPFVKCGRLVRYREADVCAFVENRTLEHTHSTIPCKR